VQGVAVPRFPVVCEKSSKSSRDFSSGHHSQCKVK